MRGLPTLQDLFDPRGRSSRAGLMKVAALLMAADLVLVAVLAATGASFAGPAAVAFKLASVWLATVGVARRLHDLDLSAWWLAKALAALIGWSILVSFSLLSTYTAAQVLDPAGRGSASAGSRYAAVRNQANSRITASTARLSPALAATFLTLPSRSARRMFSIFMASTTASASPAFTS